MKFLSEMGCLGCRAIKDGGSEITSQSWLKAAGARVQIHDSESPFKAEKRHRKRWLVFHVEDTAWRAEALAFKSSSFASLCDMATGTMMLKFNVTPFSV